jgi:nucleotide-binding universal stress UspA family protein
MLSKILTPLDGTEIAEAGLVWAEHAAKRSGASLHLLTVVDAGQPDSEAKTGEAGAYLQSRRDQLKNRGLTVKMEVATGEPAQTILERAEAVDLTVVSSGTVRWLISAVLDRVLQKMTRPLVVVRASSTHAPITPNTDKILVAVDQSDQSGEILPVVRDLAKALEASIVVCHAVAPVLDEYGQPALAHTTSASASLHDANCFVEQVAQQLHDEGIEVETVVAVGDAPGQIVRTAQRSGAGLIALATRGRDHLDSRLVGSTANAVLHSTRLPCLLTRRTVVGAQTGPRSGSIFGR